MGTTLKVAVAAVLAGLVMTLANPSLGEASRIRLGKAEARLDAENEAVDLMLTKDWAYDYEIGSCYRQSRYKITCSGQISGESFYCSSYSGNCYTTSHHCFFDVSVHRAGYSAYGQLKNNVCT
jgi:hypothetical protein